MNAATPTKLRGDWILTYTGKQFWPLDPHPADVCLEDIAHSISNICRYGGHCRSFYSVAQHSVLVSDLLPPELRLDGLLHDAAEAYVGDMVRPLKRCLPEYEVAEEKVVAAIRYHFGLFPTPHKLVKVADDVALVTERRDLVTRSPYSWGEYLDNLEPHPDTIIPLPPTLAHDLFMETFRKLADPKQY